MIKHWLSLLCLGTLITGLAEGKFVEECVSNTYPPKGRPVVPTHVVNLDLPPKQRWSEVIKDKGPQLKALLQYFKSFMTELLGSVGTEMINFIDDHGEEFCDTLPQPFGDEIKGIAAEVNIPVGEVMLYNIFYEVFTVCTSIVGNDDKGVMYHARNLDFGLFMGWNGTTHAWDIPKLLRPMVVMLDFQKGGKTVYKTVNFAGYIGVLTGIKPGVFTLTMNERFNIDGGYIGILKWILGDRNIHWMGFLTRNTLENAGSYAEAKTALANTPMLAPAYFILGGNQSGQATVITRARDKAVDVWDLNPSKGMWYLLETNYDHWEKPFFLDDRRTPGNKCMEQKTAKNLSIPTLFDVLNSRPVLNLLTTYAALMQVDKGHLETHLMYCKDPGCAPW